MRVLSLHQNRLLEDENDFQSNADEVTSKRSKAANNDGEEGSVEVEEQPVKKAATKGKGKKEKKSRCVTLQYKHLPTYNPLVK